MKIMKSFSGLALLLALLLSLTACGGRGSETEPKPLPSADEVQQDTVSGEEEAAEQAPEENTALPKLVLGYYVNKTISPYTGTNQTNQTLSALLYEPLFTVTPEFQAESCLAVSCSRGVDGLWTLRLRSDVRFWNGETLTAEDVRYSLEQAKGEDSRYADQLRPMEELEVTGDYTLTFRWTEERGTLSRLLEIPIVQKGTAGDDLPMGTGAYFPSLGEEGMTGLIANLNWWQKKELPVEEIGLYAVSDSDLMIYGFDRGDITLVASDLTSPDSLGYSGQFETWDYVTSHLIYLGCNTAQGACKDAELRQALQSSIDRTGIVQSLLSGHAVASPLTFLPDTACYDSELAALYAQADSSGLADWAGKELTLIVNADSAFKTTVAQFLAASLNEAGLTAQVRELSWSAYEQALADGAYDLYLGEVKLNADFDLTELVSEGGTLNFSGFTSQSVEDALNGYLQASEENRPAAAGAFSRALVQESPILPICFEEHSVLTAWGKIEHLTATQSNLLYSFDRWVLKE